MLDGGACTACQAGSLVKNDVAGRYAQLFMFFISTRYAERGYLCYFVLLVRLESLVKKDAAGRYAQRLFFIDTLR